MRYRIEAIQPGVRALVLRNGVAIVNGIPFRLLEGRVISDPVGDEAIEKFRVPGYLLVREDPPYEVVASLDPADVVRVSTASRAEAEGEEKGEAPEGEATEEPAASPGRKRRRG